MEAQSNRSLEIARVGKRPRVRIVCLTTLLVALGANVAAQDGAKTREQVRRELAEAQALGDVIPAGEASLTLRQQHPERYPAVAAPAGMTRLQVKANLADAIRDGDLIAAGESGQSLRELSPGRYPAPSMVAGRTRQQVRQELAEAIRTGDIISAGESGQTLREQYPQRYRAAGSEKVQQAKMSGS
jgi:hypothetical protein